MQEERHEPYQQPPLTAEQQQAQSQEQARQAQQAEQQQAAQVEQQQAMHAERQQAQQPLPPRAPEREAEERRTLLSPEQREQYRSRWKDIQIEFLTDPRKSAEDANRLVDEMVQDVNKQLADRCSKMEQEWQQGKPSTEDLRLALGHYRSFFDQLLSV